ncbi:MAG: MFS transporter [Nitratireductor sp.]|nr:MFS transporter [Nitratireductor sp.]MCB1421389.1 MFS transporter [Nitratireductor sp.]MCB1459202.1 MFS transporter [Nitratireductor sp.]
MGAIWTLALSMLLASMGTSIANIALPAIALSMSQSIAGVQWVVTAYLLPLTVMAVAGGHLGDRFGLRTMLLFGIGLFTLASLACAVAPNLWILIAARAFQGTGASFLMTVTIALVSETADGKRVGTAMGLLGTMSAIGTAAGPSLGGILISLADWRGVFLVLVPLGLLALGMGLRFLPAGGGPASLAGVRLASLRNFGLVPRLAANLCVAAVMMTTLIVGPFFLGIALELGAATVGFVMSVGPVISILSGVPSGRLVDRWSAQQVSALGLAAMTAGAFALAFLPEHFGVAGYLAAIAILTPGYQLFQAANNTAVMEGVPGERKGTVSGLLGFSRNLGLVLGAVVMSALFASGVAADELQHTASQDIANGMRRTFLVAGMVLFAMLWLTRPRQA